MAWYLDINPTNQAGNQYITIPAFDITGDFTIDIDCEIYNTTTTGADGFVFSGGTSSGGFELYRDGSANTFRPSLWRNNIKNFVSASNIWSYVSGSTANPRRITIRRIGNTVSSDFAGTAGTNITIATGDNIVISAIGARSGGTFTLGMRLYRMRMYQAGSLVRDYSPSASGGSGVTLTDTVSGQNGTFQNPPAGNAQWVFYDAGGTTDATISYDIGAIDFAVSAEPSAPTVSASVDYDIGSIEFSVAASAFAPGTIATVSYDIGAVEFSVSASSSVPVFQSEIAYDIGAIEFNIQAAATAAGNFATIAYDIGAIDFNVSAGSSVPVVSATASYDIGEVSFSISAAASAPGSAATVSFDIGEIVFAVSASSTGQVPQDISATIGYDIGAISFSVSATVTGIGPGSSVGYGVQFIEPSRGFTFTEPSRGVQF